MPCIISPSALVFLCILSPLLMQLAGAGILGMGIWVKVDSDSFLQLVNDTGESSLTLLSSASYVLIAVGALLLVIGFLGCCGACMESKCMLLTVSNV